jgi:hypothetical protein
LGNLRIGETLDTSRNYINGTVDDVRIYNTARTQAEITTDMDNSANPTITSCSITPTALVIGDNLTIAATIKNNRASAIPISTQAPDSGFTYTEAQSFESLGYGAISGKFRIGIDDATGTSPGGYPWRWGFGPPSTTTLAAGASTTITGTITMGTAGTKNLSMGLVEEYIDWIIDGQCPTTVTVTAVAPTVTTTGATGVTSTSEALSGSANPKGTATTGWFRYSTTDPGTCNNIFGTATGSSPLGSGTTAVTYSQTVEGLALFTTYWYCAIASNSAGTGYGSVLSFTTSTTSTADIKANGSNGPVTVNAGDSVSISWTSSSTTSCTVSGGPGGSGTSGSFAWVATSAGTSTTFSISCTGGTATDSVTVTVGAAAACPNKQFVYCYLVSSDRSSFVIWAQLDNANDPELNSKPNAICTLGSPDVTPPGVSPYNYCVQSSSL